MQSAKYLCTMIMKIKFQHEQLFALSAIISSTHPLVYYFFCISSKVLWKVCSIVGWKHSWCVASCLGSPIMFQKLSLILEGFCYHITIYWGWAIPSVSDRLSGTYPAEDGVCQSSSQQNYTSVWVLCLVSASLCVRVYYRPFFRSISMKEDRRWISSKLKLRVLLLAKDCSLFPLIWRQNDPQS